MSKVSIALRVNDEDAEVAFAPHKTLLEVLREEISEYDEELARFPWMVVANKMDSDQAEENLKNFRKRFHKVEIIPISAELEIGLDDLRAVLFERVASGRK